MLGAESLRGVFCAFQVKRKLASEILSPKVFLKKTVDSILKILE